MASKPENGSVHQRAIDALMALLAEKDWNDVSLIEIASRSGLTLAELRGAFPSKGAILAGFARTIDQQVLKGDEGATDLEDQPPRERLFDVVMRRFDALKPYKAAIRSARKGLLNDPLAASAWNRVETNSAQWMLAAAGIEESGATAAVKAQGLAVIFARVLRTWLDDDDSDMPKTMRELDRQLRYAERLVETGDVILGACRPFRGAIESLLARRPRKRETEATTEDATSAI
ncbi:TetR/AcrR family transcriptional regulator [Flaviflagellibacter deserti]|uniref:TetR/AcrR family transcriptional regulator n=1 Tax=Flaviflagellibacter deserti TaxID=2267266 RepID=A0ABV9YZM4_9HYPH